MDNGYWHYAYINSNYYWNTSFYYISGKECLRLLGDQSLAELTEIINLSRRFCFLIFCFLLVTRVPSWSQIISWNLWNNTFSKNYSHIVKDARKLFSRTFRESDLLKRKPENLLFLALIFTCYNRWHQSITISLIEIPFKINFEKYNKIIWRVFRKVPFSIFLYWTFPNLVKF